MTAAMATLVQAGWDPVRPDAWKDSQGKTLPSCGQGPVAVSQILVKLKEDLQTVHWEKASAKLDGQGLEEGYARMLFHQIVAAIKHLHT